MHIAVVHDNGLSGRVILERLKQSALHVSPVLVSRPELLKPDDVSSCLPQNTDIIVNTLQLSDPQAAEKDPEHTRHLAFSLPMAFAEHARTRDLILVQLSSIYIFDGRKQSAYISTNPGHPFSQLGDWQWECEQAVRALLPRHLILRVGWMLERFVRMILNHSEASGSLAMASRYRGQPSPLNDLARVLTGMLQQLDCGAEAWGTYQYAAADDVSLYELGQAICHQLEPECPVQIVDEVAPWMQLEPHNATLGCVKIRNTFGIKQQSWRQGLKQEIELVCQGVAKSQVGTL